MRTLVRHLSQSRQQFRQRQPVINRRYSIVLNSRGVDIFLDFHKVEGW